MAAHVLALLPSPSHATGGGRGATAAEFREVDILLDGKRAA
jgi:hypothetical protein